MSTFKSVTSKRLIVQAIVNGRGAYFLIDTGASVGLIDEDKERAYRLVRGRRYNGTLVGAGGEIGRTYICNTFPTLDGVPITQFLLCDISAVRGSIYRETGIEILGIIGLKQMKALRMIIDTAKNEIRI